MSGRYAGPFEGRRIKWQSACVELLDTDVVECKARVRSYVLSTYPRITVQTMVEVRVIGIGWVAEERDSGRVSIMYRPDA